LYASLFKATRKGHAIGVDEELRSCNRKAIDVHILRPYITAVGASSIDLNTVAGVKSHIKPDKKVMVMLDANHTEEHVKEVIEKPVWPFSQGALRDRLTYGPSAFIKRFS
jgi:cephalosporin hydroxylase